MNFFFSSLDVSLGKWILIFNSSASPSTETSLYRPGATREHWRWWQNLDELPVNNTKFQNYFRNMKKPIKFHFYSSSCLLKISLLLFSRFSLYFTQWSDYTVKRKKIQKHANLLTYKIINLYFFLLCFSSHFFFFRIISPFSHAQLMPSYK